MSSCLGIVEFGQCFYDAGKPALSYFTLGDIVAALSLTLLLPQFLKRSYRFRLAVRNVSVVQIYSAIAVGTGCVLVAAVLPHLPIRRDLIVSYPLVWELGGASSLIAAYAVVAYAALTSPKVTASNIERFARVSANYLAEGLEEEFVSYANDLLPNIVSIGKLASFVEGRRPRSAFYDFTHRRKIDAGRFASALLQVLTDKEFCETLVSKLPWTAADIVQSLEVAKVTTPGIASFVQQIAQQAISSPKSRLLRELDYQGFHAAPMLSQALFGSAYVIREYEPFSFLNIYETPISKELATRICGAAELTLKVVLSVGSYSEDSTAQHIRRVLESTGRAIYLQVKEGGDSSLIWPYSSSVKRILVMGREALSDLTVQRRRRYYADHDVELYEAHNVFATIGDIAFESLEVCANEFAGFEDPWWHHCIEMFHAIFDMFRDVPDGMDPIQQRVALQLEDKLRHNMTGYYPSVSRIALACVGPYDAPGSRGPRTPFGRLRRSVYRCLKGLVKLAVLKPEKVSDFLPPNVTFEVGTGTLTQRYRSGEVRFTNLSRLRIMPGMLKTSAVAR